MELRMILLDLVGKVGIIALKDRKQYYENSGGKIKIIVDKTHSDILKWIESKLPKEKPPFRPSTTKEDLEDPLHLFKEGKTLGYNDCLTQALKNLGIKEV